MSTTPVGTKIRIANHVVLAMATAALVYRILEIQGFVGDGHPFRPYRGLALNAALLFQALGWEVGARFPRATWGTWLMLFAVAAALVASLTVN